VALARDLVNEPPSTLGPVELAARAADAAAAAGLTAEILDAAAIERLGMGALLAVSRGSGSGPRVVHLTYTPRRGGATRRVVLVGKGVTFDSGGLDLKTSAGMIHMKADMAGAAAVLAAMTVLGRLGCRAEVHAFLGLVENMTGEAAYKPGDILATYSGKTVEVTNTDAEGRLVLCDLLAYACATVRPDAVVDLATLTGACVVALGPSASGLFSRDEALRAALLEAGSQAGERLWPMPLYDDYLESLRRGPADLRNSGDRYGGAIIAALFLGEFVPRSIAWGHLDIAGPAFLEADGPEAVAGGTGTGVGTALRWLESL
jgi:leucyl aminopeptidase